MRPMTSLSVSCVFTNVVGVTAQVTNASPDSNGSLRAETAVWRSKSQHADRAQVAPLLESGDIAAR